MLKNIRIIKKSQALLVFQLKKKQKRRECMIFYVMFSHFFQKFESYIAELLS